MCIFKEMTLSAPPKTNYSANLLQFGTANKAM